MRIRRPWLLGGLALGGLAAMILLRRKGDSGYDDDDIDAAGQGDDAFGERHANAPEQRWAPAEMRHDVTPEQLSMAARVETSWEAIRTVWPTLELDEIRKAEGDLDRLAGLIAEKAEQPRDQVKERLVGIIEAETPDPSYPAH